MQNLFSKLLSKKAVPFFSYMALFALITQLFENDIISHTAEDSTLGMIGYLIKHEILAVDFPLQVTAAVGVILLLCFFYGSLALWSLVLLVFLYLILEGEAYWSRPAVFLIFAVCFFLLRFVFSVLFFKGAKKLKLTPKISQTEQIALQVGEAWLEKEFFTGRPNFKNLLSQKLPMLSKEEKDFLDRQTEEFCSLSTEWDFLKSKKLSPKEEESIKKERLFGLSLPKQYKGLAFSHWAHAKVIEKIAFHNIPLSIVVMVPNSLGPAELLLKYGTEKQKDQYLGLLASAQLWPCFALTETHAGSDAGSIRSEGILFKEGGELKIKLNFEKRWITLSSKADLIALAVRLKDPEQLYSERKDLGITCLLAPSRLKGIERGCYHDPMGLPIYNAPIKGKNVIVSAETAVIGGLKQAGQGWKMIMESLSAGRSISLPSLSSACAKRVSWIVGAYAFLRKQFNRPIGKFSAVQEKLAEIAGLTHLVTSGHAFTLTSLSQGIVSPVVSALTKYQLTELTQKIVKQGMDIMGGAGLSLGPKNRMALLHTAMPLTVTVEGANSLSRTFIVYGQGLIKTHPQAYAIIQALENNNLKSFHKTFWKFLYQTLCHFVRSCVFTLTRAYLYWPREYKQKRYLQKLAWSSSLFAFLSNLNLLCLGGRLKTKGPLNGRFADWLSFQYMISAVLWQSQRGEADLASKWALDYCFANIQNHVMDILNNYPTALVRWFLKPLAWLLRINPMGFKPSDKLNQKLADQILEDKEFREKLCENMFIPEDDSLQILKRAYDLSLKEREILNKISKSHINLETAPSRSGFTAAQSEIQAESAYSKTAPHSSKSGKLPPKSAKTGGDFQNPSSKPVGQNQWDKKHEDKYYFSKPKAGKINISKQSFFKSNKIKLDLCQEALNQDLISQEEFDTLKQAQKAQEEAIQVDVFSEEEYFKS